MTDKIKADVKFFMPVKGGATQCFRPGEALDGAALAFALKHGYAKEPPKEEAKAAPAASDAPTADAGKGKKSAGKDSGDL